MRTFLFILAFSGLTVGYSQSGRVTIDRLEDLIKKKEYRALQSEASSSMAIFRKQHLVDSLIVYAYYEGIAILKLKGIPVAENWLVTTINHDIVKADATGDQIVAAYLAASNLLGFEGDSKRAYSMLQKLMNDVDLRNKIKKMRYRIESTMGYFSMRLGRYSISSGHYRKSLELFPPEKVKTDEYFIALNSMGILMFYSAKLDSSIYYFIATNDFLKKLDSSPVNTLYRPAMVDANISNVYAEKGETNKSIEYAEAAIEKYRKFLNTKTNFPQKKSAQRSLLFCMDNLATTLLETGDYLKAKNLYTFALSEKQAILGENDPEIYKSFIALAGVSLSREETAKAINYADRALGIIRKLGDTLTLYDADAYSKLAGAYYKRHDVARSSFYYQKAFTIFELIHGDEFSIQYLDFLNKYALFKANTNDRAGAELLGGKGLVYALKTNQPHSLPVAMQLLNQVKVHLQLHDYKSSLNYADKAIFTFDKLIKDAPTILDSISIENSKASAVLGKAKSAYYLLDEKNPGNIQKILGDIQVTSAMFERRKLYYSNEEDVNATIESYKEINDFINLLQLELYRITNGKSYLDAVIERNESLVYTRLKRSVNNRLLNVQFKDVPQEVQAQEASLKLLLDGALRNSKSEPASINSYFKQSKKWQDFLRMLKKQYPVYYQARYGTGVKKTIEEYRTLVPEGSQVVRFYMVNEDIYALVLSRKETHWTRLAPKGLPEIVSRLREEQSLEETGYLTFELYQQLWKPVESFIHEKRIIIIPDGIIYNVSFEMLTTKPVKNAQELIAFSLLKKHAFSYQYSLDALDQRKSHQQRFSGISVFAPAFSEMEKKDYKTALQSDSLHIDKNYLTLLPLPFSRDFANRLKRDFESTVYLGEESTVSNFKKNAGNHAVIYIGTHAESNNQFPEYSRILFAKDLNTPMADNSLYLFDVYNQNLNADLAVLSACETGQSNFFPGEGMISMAHAFNYAGSRSMLTGLWKIDERASVLIMDAFYKNLDEGMSKDVALQKAKLSYLGNAHGRMLTPQHWAGLVIMGDTSSIAFGKNKIPYYLVAAGISVLLFIGFFYWKKKERSEVK